jgi:bacterioferritin
VRPSGGLTIAIYKRLWSIVRAEAIDEMKHADEIVARILYLDGVPNLQRLGNVRVGQSVPQQLALDLDVEKTAIKRLNEAVAQCREESDNGTRELLEKVLVDEEHHADWLEAQLGLIEQVGVQNYLSEQIRD